MIATPPSDKIFLQLLSASDENEVSSIIQSNHGIFAQKHWFPIDGNDNNFGLIEAQGRNPERALIEKVTNAIDAALIMECRKKGIDPEGPNAPKSIKAALEQLFSIPNGDLSNLSENRRDQLASNIYVIAENLKGKNANFYIIDQGEGQSPEDFKGTFLKFGGNKSNTYFVHGRFGTGSFGVLPNAGDNKFPLITSRNYRSASSAKWGWTLIRKNRSGDINTKPSWYEYLTKNGEIHSFYEADLAPFLKTSVNYEKLDLDTFVHGTVIKLFDYDMANSSDVDRDLFRIFNRYLFAPALPFRVLDAQVRGKVGPGKQVEGNLIRLKNNKDELEGEKKLQIKDAVLPKLGKVDIDIYIAKKRRGKKSYIDSERLSTNEEAVFFIRNGQSHGELSRQFVRDDLGLEHIAKDISILIDCSNTIPIDFDDVFPPTRDSLRENRHRNAVQDTLRKELREFDALKKIDSDRRNQVISETIEKTKDIEDFINDLFRQDPMLRKLVSGPLKLADQSGKGTKQDVEFEGKYFPSFLRVSDKDIKKQDHKLLPINSYIKISFNTDAKNDYLHRDVDKGELIFNYPGEVRSIRLYDGVLKLKVMPPAHGPAGEKVDLKVTLTHPYDEPLIENVQILLDTAIVPTDYDHTRIIRPRKYGELALPKVSVYNRDEWIEMGYDETEVCELAVEKDNENSSYILKEVKLNVDFPDFKAYLNSQNPSERKIKEMKNQFLQAMYISAIIVHSGYSKDGSYKRELVNIALQQIGKVSPFMLFSLQKKWLSSTIEEVFA